MLNPIAEELNKAIGAANPGVLRMFSRIGEAVFFPKGIMHQSQEAKEMAAPSLNATIGIATEGISTMFLPSVMSQLRGLSADDCLPYASSFGLKALREGWAERLREKNPMLAEREFSLPIVTCGISHGLSIVSEMFLDSQDALLLPDKHWGNVRLIMATRREASLHCYRLFSDSALDLAAFGKLLSELGEERKKLVIYFNYPNNPAGYSPTLDEAKRSAELLFEQAQRGTEIVAVIDDAYFGLCYGEDACRESLFSLLCDLHPGILAVKLDGATKEAFVWGLRVGFLTYATSFSASGTAAPGSTEAFYEAMEKKTAAMVRATVSNVSHLSQTLLLNALSSPAFDAEQAAKISLLEERALLAKEEATSPRYTRAWELYPFNSGYFMCLRLKTVEAEPLRTHLLKAHQVGVIATSDFDLRVAFSCVEAADIPALFEKIYAAVCELEAAGA